MVFKEILITIGVVLIIHYLLKLKRFLQLASKIPRSKFDLSWNGIKVAISADNKTIFRMIYESLDGINGLAKTWFGPMLYVIISSPEDVKIVMNSKECLDKPYFLRYPGSITQGSLFGDLKFWQKHRKILDNYFGQQKLKQLHQLFDEKSKVLTKMISKKLGQGEFNVFHYMTALTLEIILNAMELNVDIQNLDSETRDKTINGLEKASKLVTMRIFRLWLHPEFIYRQTKMYFEEEKAKTNSAFCYADEVFKNIREKLNNDFEENDKSSSTFIRALMNPKYKLTDEEINDEIKTLLIAAQDTTGISISATLLLLAMNKDKQEKVVKEMREVIGISADNPITDIDQLNKLEYLEMAINEALRLLPVVPYVFRSIENEITTSEGMIIPANCILFIPIFKIHRNTTFWGEDAETFRPERFERENIKKVNPYAFIPFAKGPRMCLGWRYAMVLMKIQLCNFLMRYEVDTSLKLNELEYELNVTLNVCQGFQISIKERKM